MNLSRRGFLKVMGLAAVTAFTQPELSLNRIAFPDFIPGQQYRMAFVFPFPVEEASLRERKEFMNELDDWLKTRIPPNYLDFNKIEYFWQNLDYGSRGRVAISYFTPEKPIRLFSGRTYHQEAMRRDHLHRDNAQAAI